MGVLVVALLVGCGDGGAWSEDVMAGDVTVEVGTVGAACSGAAPCAPDLACMETPAGRYCTRECGPGAPCPEHQDARCVKLSQGGNLCVRNCVHTADCAPGLACVGLSKYPQITVCYPE